MSDTSVLLTFDGQMKRELSEDDIEDAMQNGGFSSRDDLWQFIESEFRRQLLDTLAQDELEELNVTLSVVDDDDE